MSSFSHIILAIASGPGFASPTIDFYQLARGDLDDAGADEVDRMLAGCDFFKLGDFLPKFEILDGPHKSTITVKTADGGSHAVRYGAAGLPAQLEQIVDLVVKRGKHTDLES